ncbi:hypothetical protein EYF80_039455 [Liparis tanakae]|uniref:Uncharacterized protein n=1 Tax=Liparis tanakae TaxID=230148 RepID=A0A4Z2G9U5_9TELE|nr:hypothetical protein EYF80_039455 [Liparis tanakae]
MKSRSMSSLLKVRGGGGGGSSRPFVPAVQNAEQGCCESAGGMRKSLSVATLPSIPPAERRADVVSIRGNRRRDGVN